MNSETFHIIGGGIAGLSCAIAASNAGHHAIIMEKAAKFEAIGAGLQLGPNAARALQKLGAWEAVSAITNSPTEIHIRNGVDGRTLKRVPLGKSFEQRFGLPYRVAHRADLVQALLDVARSKPKIEIQINTEVTDLTKFKNVIAADGIWSKTREQLFPGSAAIVTREIFHRALIPNVSDNNVNLWLYPGGHVVHYPVGIPTKTNLVAITQGESPEKHFVNACDDLKKILAQIENWTTWPAAYAPPMKRWHNSTTLLVGDAAHGTLPYMAQGAAMALEDAAELQSTLQSHKDLEVVFAKFSAVRLPRTHKLHTATLRSGKIYHADGPLAHARNTAIRLAPEALFLSQLNWLYK